jgi:hypothetical protein
VTGEPDISVGVHVCQIIVEILAVRYEQRTRYEKRTTHNPDGVEQALIYECVLDARQVTLPSTAVAPAHGCPRPVDTRTAATEQQVVVQLIFARGRAATAEHGRRRALNSEHDGAVIRRRKDVPAEAVLIWFPTKGRVLHRGDMYEGPEQTAREVGGTRTQVQFAPRSYQPTCDESL